MVCVCVCWGCVMVGVGVMGVCDGVCVCVCDGGVCGWVCWGWGYTSVTKRKVMSHLLLCNVPLLPLDNLGVLLGMSKGLLQAGHLLLLGLGLLPSLHQ